MATIGEKIRELRKRKGLSQAALSRRVGISQPSLCDLESGKSRMPSGKNLIKLAEALAIDPRELLETSNPTSIAKLDKPRLIDALAAVEAALSYDGRTIRPRIKAKLVAHLYESGAAITESEAARLLELIR